MKIFVVTMCGDAGQGTRHEDRRFESVGDATLWAETEWKIHGPGGDGRWQFIDLLVKLEGWSVP